MSQTTAENFVTVVSVGVKKKPDINENISFDTNDSDYVTVLTIGDDDSKVNYATEEVIVYRLPGERLGFGLKFEGGTKANEYVKRLFIQSCAANSPASRVKSSWGKLTEGDEVLEIDSISVNTMTRIDCVRCLKESNVAIKLLVRHTYENKLASAPLVISAEEKRAPPPPPPVPPRKISRKLAKNKENADAIEANNNNNSNKKKLQSPRGSIRSYNSPDVSRRDRRFSDGSLGPPDAEVYVDLFLQESTQSLSESDDTGSTISTVIDRFGSFPTTTTSSFSGSLPSTPTAVQREIDISNININDDEDFIINKSVKPIPLPREENNNIIIDDVNPLCFQDAPLSYGNESTNVIIPNEIGNIKDLVIEETKKKPQVPPRSKDTHLTTEKNEMKKIIENLPRLVDFVPKSVNGSKEIDDETDELYQTKFDFYDRETDTVDNYSNGVDLYSTKWNLSSQLATIGEVEEEGSSDFSLNRSSPKSTPIVIVENIDKNEDANDEEDTHQDNKGTCSIMATIPSDSRQPPDGHEFPDFIENHNESSLNKSYYTDADMNRKKLSSSESDLTAKAYKNPIEVNDEINLESELYARSRRLIEMNNMHKQEHIKWCQMFEQRKKGISKLKGLVIPESVESDPLPSVDIPEIKSQTATAATVFISGPKIENTFRFNDDLEDNENTKPAITTLTSNSIPKYSPAFRRKSLQVYTASINKSETSEYCDKTTTKCNNNKINDDDLNPPKSLESISSPTKSDCSFEYTTTKRKNKDVFQKYSNNKVEDESDNDSAVSSSQSSYKSRYSPPSSPTRSCDLSYKKEDDIKDESKNRLLKPSSLEAINRKNILASAKCRSGKDFKIGSPVIRRKQEDTDNSDKTVEVMKEPPVQEPETPPKKSVPVRVVPVGSSIDETDETKKVITATEIKTVKETSKENTESGKTLPSPKVLLKQTPSPLTDTKPKETYRLTKAAPVSVKLLKQSFENLNTSPLLPERVPITKPLVSKRAIKVDSLENKVISTKKPETPQIPTPLRRKSITGNKKSIVLKLDEWSTLGISISDDKGFTINRIRYSSVAYNDGRLKKGDKILSINGIPTTELTHQEAVDLLNERLDEFTIVIEDGNDTVPSPTNNSPRTRTLSKRSSSLSLLYDTNTLQKVESKKSNTVISIEKDKAGLGFSIEGGKDSPKGDVPLLVKKIFTGGAAEKSGLLQVGDEIIQMNDIMFTNLTRMEAWNAMKKIPDGKIDIHIYR